MSDRAPASLPWTRRLEARVTALVVLVALAVSAVVIVTTHATASHALARAASDLDAARSAFERLADDRAEFASVQATLVTALPVFRAHMTSREIAGDAPTLTAMVDEYRRELKADFAVLSGVRGGRLAASGWPADASVAGDAMSTPAGTRHSARGIRPIGSRLFLVVTEPATFAEELLGTFSVGYALDDGVARRLAAVTHTEVNLVFGARLFASSAPAPDRAVLATLAAAGRLAPGSVSLSTIGSTRYAVEAFALGSLADDATARLVLLQDWTPAQRALDDLRNRLLAAGFAIFAVALGVSLVFSRRISRPLMDVAAAAEEIAAGNWSRRVDVRGSAEATITADSFNRMTTSLRHWYEEARRRDDELRQAQKLEALGRLAGGIAHDFNNLLTAIRGGAEMLYLSVVPGDPRRDDAAEIIRSADRAAALTRQLLAFSRRQITEPRLVALDRVVAGTEQMLRRLIGEDIELMTVVDIDNAVVRVDPTQLEQVLVNLVINARDAMPDGGKIRIALSEAWVDPTAANVRPALPPGAYVRLSVADNGSGMSHETVSHIFEPFFTTKSEGTGTGLGLATVHAIVEQANGGIDVETAPGRGTTFHVYLPQVEGESDVREVAAAASAIRGTETVLLVDDAADVARLIAMGLRQNGYTVLEASDAHHALEIIKSHDRSIDVLLTDVVMPRMNGRELADRAVVLQPALRVLYMSGHSDDMVLRRGVEAARVHFIQKPFAMDALAAKIREVLESPAV